MKFLPIHYRETQAEFVGKKGNSWHLTVCQSKQGEELVVQTFVHIIESGLQDSHTVVTVMEHVLKTLKHEHPELTRVVYRQDTAGCYHCATTILACKLLRERTKVDLSRIDFCDPQGGKGPCDRKAAQIKMHVKQYINQGHSVTTPADLRKAIESNEGICGVRVTVVPVPKTTIYVPKEHQVGGHQYFVQFRDHDSRCTGLQSVWYWCKKFPILDIICRQACII